nr:MAG TPA: hypothetical protein [Caudoviricetes sp.]DAT84301.1 MAG TPA: hypothetical protein [Caudoviricetes sp.]
MVGASDPIKSRKDRYASVLLLLHLRTSVVSRVRPSLLYVSEDVFKATKSVSSVILLVSDFVTQAPELSISAFATVLNNPKKAIAKIFFISLSLISNSGINPKWNLMQWEARNPPERAYTNSHYARKIHLNLVSHPFTGSVQ